MNMKPSQSKLLSGSWLPILLAMAVFPATSSAFDERAILLEFFNTTGGDQWLKKDNWGSAQPICSWHGVSCVGGSLTGTSQVDSLQLPENNIANSIPSNLYSMPLLRFLNLEGNPLTNAGFDGFTEATTGSGDSPLETLALNGCNLRDVSGIGNAPPSLQDLRLSDNNLRGDFPEEIFKLTNLRRLFLDQNGFSGTIPRTVGNMGALIDFHAIGVPFRGQIPSEFGKLDRLVTLILRDNEFTGTIPSELNNMVNLEILSIGRSPEAGQGKLGGPLPSFSQLPYLELLDLSLNNLNGTIPRDLFLENQRTDDLGIMVRLDGNELTGTLPKQLAWIDSMDLSLTDNKIVGPIPQDLCQKNQWMTGLVEQFSCDAILCPAGTHSEDGKQTLQSSCQPCSGAGASSPYLGQTSCLGRQQELGAWRILPEFYQALQGQSWINRDGWSTIDTVLQNKKLSDIDKSDLDYCNFYGVTCSSSGEITSIVLQDNLLYGVIPSSIFSLSAMTTFDVTANRVSMDEDSFVKIAETKSLLKLVLSHTDVNSFAGLENAESLKEIYADGNSFQSVLPDALFTCTNVEIIEMSNSQIRGPIPTTIGNLKNLKRFELRWNDLSGVLPSELGMLINIEEIELAFNNFDGNLPNELNSLSNLKRLDLSRAQRGGLGGQLPSLANLQALESLELSYNNFLGNISDNFLSGVSDKTKAMKIVLSYNRLSGSVPRSLDDFASMVLELEGNMISNLPSIFCDNSFWMEGYVAKASSGCNAILCPPGSYSKNGRESQSSPCTPCADSQYYGTTECGGTATDVSVATGSDGLPIAVTEVEILDKLYQATNGDEWTASHENWTNPGVSICYREGVSCDDSGKVNALRLNRFGLIGEIPTEIFTLGNNRVLGFTDNNVDLKFHGIAKSTNLQTLLMSNTGVTSLEGLENSPPTLNSIHLARNDLTGTFPTRLANLDTLHKLFLNENRLSSTIPTEIALMTGLQELHLFDNLLTGHLVSDLGALPSLEVLELQRNLLSGPIPSNLGQLKVINTIDISDQRGSNKLSGPLYPFASNPSLELFNASMNEFLGTIPPNVLSSADITKQITIDLSQNKISGGVPSQLSDFEKLNLYLGGNQISELPEDLCSIKSWMDGQVGTIGSCDAILCPPNSYSAAGRATETMTCQPCDNAAATYFGSMDCSSNSTTSERDILMKFFDGLNGDRWLNNMNWGSDNGVCTWFGVTCNDQLSVVELKLASNQIVGTTDQLDAISSIFGLPNLQVLDLKGNSILIDFQRIPFTSSLQSMRVSGTGLTSLAGIGRAKNLTRLHATDNLLNSTMPNELFELENLRSLYLSFNAIQGSVPPQIAKLTNLEEFYMYGNQLNKGLPSELGLLQNLREVVLAKNSLTGTIPSEYSALPKLEQLSIYDQQSVAGITGNLPTFELAPNLWFFDGSNCDLTGPIPDNFMAKSVHTSDTITLILTNNQLSGTVPASLKKFNSLDIDLAGNKIEGISQDLCGKSDWMKGELGLVKSCDAILCPPGKYNEQGRQTGDTPCLSCKDLSDVPYYGQTQCGSFEGERGTLNFFFAAAGGGTWKANGFWGSDNPICSWEGVECANGNPEDDEGVTAIKLEENNMVGSLPTSIWSLPSLQTLDVSGNENLAISFDGLSNAAALEILQISNTKIESIAGISHASKLKELFIDENGLTGTFPYELFELHGTLEKLRFSANFFYGALPTEINKMTKLVEFHAADNEFYSTIPTEITQLQRMQSIALNENLFYGELPTQLSTMPDLQIFSVRRETKSGPKLSGNIPTFDKNPSLTVLFLDGNDFSGTIPDSFLASSNSVYLVDLKNNSLSKGIPESLGRLGELDIRLEGNQISYIPSSLCDNRGWMGGNVGRLKNCDAILCSPGTASPNGRALSSANECVTCSSPHAAPFYGSRTCDPVLSERDILVKLYDATNGAEWKISKNWNTNADICDWHGIGCDNGHVILINLGANNLSRTPPPELFDLPKLQILWLNSNPLEFSFQHIGRATNLMDLRVDETSLTMLAGISKAAYLTSLHIGFNPIGGPFPEELLHLGNLRMLTMNNNGFTGPVPDLTQLKFLQTLRMNNNKFTGPLPALDGMHILNVIDMGGNGLTGTIPKSFLGRLGLKVKPEIDLSNNQLTGTIPIELDRFDDLSLLLRSNKIEGIPQALCTKDNWNGGDVGSFGCDAILCPTGTANFDGRHSARSPGCAKCDEAADFYGQAACLTATLGHSAADRNLLNIAVCVFVATTGVLYLL